MSEYWQCAFIGEGTSDNHLARVLQQLLTYMRPGAEVQEFDIFKPRPGSHPRTVRGKYEAFKDFEEEEKKAGLPCYDLIFVHRDADNAGIEARVKECRELGDERVVPVIPVKMTEAWVLAHLWSDANFRDWARRKRLRLGGIEGLADPKRTLEEYLNRGRSRFMTSTEFARKRSQLVGQILADGDVKHLDAWKRLEKELCDAVFRRRPYLRNE